MPTLNISSRAIAFGDQGPNSNPQRRYFDWARNLAVTVTAPFSQVQTIQPNSSYTFFNGVRATSLASDTAFTVTLSTLNSARYRFTWTGGTNPVLRTNRALTLSGSAVTVVVNTNSTINMTLGAGAFTGVVAGDTIFIPSQNTGDAANVFNLINSGFWTVLTVVSSTNLQLVRPAGMAFVAAAETVTLSSNAQLQAFSSAGVQPGDNVSLSAGFNTATLRTYAVDTVTATWFEVLSTSPVAIEAGIVPGVAGMTFYTANKNFIRVEADQEVSVQLNGDTSDFNRISPIAAGDPEQIGWMEKFGTCFSLTVKNKSALAVNVSVYSAG